MSNAPSWLPDLIRLEDFNGDWQRYEDEIYAAFYTDFIESKISFQGMPVKITKQQIKGKERTFWHLIQEGPIEQERTPDLRRCERIKWIRAIIENSKDPNVKVWTSLSDRNPRCLLWFRDEYLVILEDRRNCWILWTAYCTSWEHTRKRLQMEYAEEIQKSQRRS